MAGRKKDVIWYYFTEQPTVSGKGVKAECKKCGKQIMGLVARMRKHVEMCSPDDEEQLDGGKVSEQLHILGNTMQHQSLLVNTLKHPNCSAQQVKRKICDSEKEDSVSDTSKKQNINAYFIKTTNAQKHVLNEQVAKFIYATNSSFRIVQHPEFRKMVAALRPGYTPPSQTEIGGDLLDGIFEQEKEKCSGILCGQMVSMSLDGWSNVHNEPIICAAVTSSTGEVYLIDTIDTSGDSHTAEYLVEVANKAIAKCEAEYKCHVRSLVTDNTGNVKSMRTQLEKDEKLNLITYGCSAHLLNLLAQDLNIPNVKEQIVVIVKYFRNNHFASAKYKQEGGLKLCLPQNVCWNTMADCLLGYLKNWPIVMKVCEENRCNIDVNVYNKVANFGLKRSAEDLLNRLRHISVALDVVQKKNCTISTAVHTWKKLEDSLKDEKLDKANMKSFLARYSQALGPPHFLAYLLDPRYTGSRLTAEEKKEALHFAKVKYSASIIPVLMNFQAKAGPFHDFLFETDVVTQVSPLDWWKTHAVGSDSTVDDDILEVVQQLLTATASSASVERIFSTFGLVQSKLRNRLGIEKAAKLVFLFKTFNSNLV